MKHQLTPGKLSFELQCTFIDPQKQFELDPQLLFSKKMYIYIG